MLEALTCNVPTVLFWSEDTWVARPEAGEVIAVLRESGILHDSPEAAARTVSVVLAEPGEWWFSARVQTARAAFLSRYGLRSENWVGDWARLLSEA
jgi:putative transferase (TIGR04331 family)